MGIGNFPGKLDGLESVSPGNPGGAGGPANAKDEPNPSPTDATDRTPWEVVVPGKTNPTPLAFPGKAGPQTQTLSRGKTNPGPAPFRLPRSKRDSGQVGKDEPNLAPSPAANRTRPSKVVRSKTNPIAPTFPGKVEPISASLPVPNRTQGPATDRGKTNPIGPAFPGKLEDLEPISPGNPGEAGAASDGKVEPNPAPLPVTNRTQASMADRGKTNPISPAFPGKLEDLEPISPGKPRDAGAASDGKVEPNPAPLPVTNRTQASMADRGKTNPIGPAFPGKAEPPPGLNLPAGRTQNGTCPTPGGAAPARRSQFTDAPGARPGRTNPGPDAAPRPSRVASETLSFRGSVR